ncbi:hypothetical protein [Wolbachia endosymbiont of Aedes albopictus]|uniref:hypothetical protein n=1 Tax=Wolbachia endosymbiont of Aedes albopictus TaxID=167957 RepID=UPI0021677216|nr:hypothetical protein [Wolbachia endosymbiont of Aedes albopictus]UVW84402.1 hypothetical protein NHG98_02780 [Wolbachia endosymbiont of Aedes albopictus]
MEMSKLTLVCDIYELTNKDRKNIQKLAREIEEGRGVAEKFRSRIFKKSSYNASTILLAKIAYKYQGREETLGRPTDSKTNSFHANRFLLLEMVASFKFINVIYYQINSCSFKNLIQLYLTRHIYFLKHCCK